MWHVGWIVGALRTSGKYEESLRQSNDSKKRRQLIGEDFGVPNVPKWPVKANQPSPALIDYNPTVTLSESSCSLQPLTRERSA